MTDERDDGERADLIKRIDLGFAVEQALGNEVSTYLRHRAEEHRQAALELLARVAPTDTAEIIKAQIEVAAVDRWQEWMAEAIMEGRQAQRLLIESEPG